MIVGIDTSSRGFHVVASEPHFRSEEGPLSRCYWRMADGDARDRRRAVYDTARLLFTYLPPGTIVAIEEPLILPKNIDTTMKLVMMAGIIEAAFWHACPDATLFWVNVSTWRRAVLNPPRGQAPRNKEGWKALAKAHVVATGGWAAVMDEQPDLYDAACIMEYGGKELTSGS